MPGEPAARVQAAVDDRKGGPECRCLLSGIRRCVAEAWAALPVSTSLRAAWSTAETQTNPTPPTRPPPSLRAPRPRCTGSSSKPMRPRPSPPSSPTRAGIRATTPAGIGRRPAGRTSALRPRRKPATPASRYRSNVANVTCHRHQHHRVVRKKAHVWRWGWVGVGACCLSVTRAGPTHNCARLWVNVWSNRPRERPRVSDGPDSSQSEGDASVCRQCC